MVNYMLGGIPTPRKNMTGRLGWLFAIYRKCSKPPTSRYIDQLLSWWIVPHVKTKHHVMGDDSLEVIGMYEQPNNIGYQPKQIYVAAWWSPTSLPFSGICLKPQKAKDQIALFFEHLFPKKRWRILEINQQAWHFGQVYPLNLSLR